VILILTNEEDKTAKFVEKELRCTETEYIRLNSESFGNEFQIEMFVRNSRPRVVLRTTNLDVDGAEIRAIWNRRPVAPIPNRRITDPQARDFASAELRSLLDGALLALDCVWVSHPSAIRAASFKMNQLKAASTHGFSLPDTTVSIDPATIRGFFRDLASKQRQTIAKLVSQGPPHAPTPGEQYSVFTTLIDENDLTVSAIAGCPAVYQEYVDKKFELRVTVVGNQVTAKTKIDWRRYDFPRTPYLPHQLEPSLEARCVALTKHMGLLFSAIDLVVRPDGEAVFLEMNPNGQWGWVEELTGLPIARAIADLLRNEATSVKDTSCP
jgi:MvdD pre-ATP grasp domain/RimK-like ATP-grasp domain